MIIKVFLRLLLLCAHIVCIDGKLEIRPVVSGVRIESDVDASGFLGYGDAGELLVEANTEVDLVIFGHGLENVEMVTFTDSVCVTSEFNVSESTFYIHKDMKIVFKYAFVAWPQPWRICLKSECHGLIQIDDDRTWIQAVQSTHETFMPVWAQCAILCLLFSISALCSGLTLGLMALTPQELSILMKSGSQREKKHAAAIYPIRCHGNRLLCTVIIMNVIVNTGITLLFDDLAEGLIAFVASTVGIVVFGEILPQSICVKYGLAVGANTIFITKFFMFLLFPITWPLGKILDKYAGVDIDVVNRSRMVEMLKMNMENDACDIDLSTLKIAIGAMELTKKSVRDVMTDIDDVFMLSEDQVLNAETMTKISDSGYTRIPVFEGNNRNKVKNLLYVSDLALIGKDNNITVKAVARFNKRRLRIVDESMPLTALMDEFKLGDYHLAMVAKATEVKKHHHGKFADGTVDSFILKSMKLVEATMMPQVENPEDHPVTLVGLITLEDITEELLQAEITDETDCYVTDDAQKKRRTNTSKKSAAELFCSEKKSERLSLHMLEMTEKWLLEKTPLFGNMNPKAFENLIQRNIREVLIVPPKNSTSPGTLNLFEAGVMSKRFLLILEGKATIRFNEKDLIFECGPWTCFGEAILEKMEMCISDRKEPSTGFFFLPDYNLTVSGPCRFLQISTSSLLHSLRITQFVKEIRTPKISITSDDDFGSPTRKASILDSSPNSRKRSSTSVMNSLALPTARLAAKIASVEELKPLME
ncbi:Metal transporter cnnm-2 [Caenorhabditis elegans]|uniref:Metal transporter cnnm-2 n=1 Tax=Caenorhabditis elegans TaxID=6239 RepID=CNNM2_CAEEL|nr:Metal transporter cnnm-2 [Caenorhabditis elegans]Q9GYL2.3 RecName: Full=Metal transporter cnnm-2; AltName: Full=CNNM family homolog 2; Flags: Precursor [Caenorhabditis elegans]CCD65954.2 Metal transporter cnnm-2 [Caenorhabditis elegans]